MTKKCKECGKPIAGGNAKKYCENCAAISKADTNLNAMRLKRKIPLNKTKSRRRILQSERLGTIPKTRRTREDKEQKISTCRPLWYRKLRATGSDGDVKMLAYQREILEKKGWNEDEPGDTERIKQYDARVKEPGGYTRGDFEAYYKARLDVEFLAALEQPRQILTRKQLIKKYGKPKYWFENQQQEARVVEYWAQVMEKYLKLKRFMEKHGIKRDKDMRKLEKRIVKEFNK